ncbi:MAG: hypothetical protein CRU78_06280 [Candidatus Accumulibacter phosphatis]|uniref:Carboxypeptidase regulatory-like domain-containing protein n=1 Tax=Candidatus Accumulibacter phosphatis TaxID=327160 RepID=A0A6A7RRU0_9PROT|nr:hypothetical protein [Candidatus Accumulibacter phosphatis]
MDRLQRTRNALGKENSVDEHTLSSAVEQTAAKLLIHVTDDATGKRGRRLETPLRWLLEFASYSVAHGKRAPLDLQVHDAHGSRVLAVSSIGPLIHLSLSPGTYRVTADSGNIRRVYTLTLEQGAQVNLYTDLAPDRQ